MYFLLQIGNKLKTTYYKNIKITKIFFVIFESEQQQRKIQILQQTNFRVKIIS